MKKAIILIGIFIILSLSLTAGDSAEVWSRLYDRVTTLDQKYTIMQKVVLLDDPSLELMLTRALEDLVDGEFYQYSEGNTQELWTDLTLMIIRELGSMKAQDSAYLVNEVMRENDGILKAESMTALGSMRALEYTNEIATVLRNLNFNTRSDRDIAEIEAFGAIEGLNRMSELEGYEPVFYAYQGWYSRRVKDLAESTLANMVPDPTDEIIKIMESADIDSRNVALQVEMSSQASPEQKSRVAGYAVELGVTSFGNNPAETNGLRTLRLEGMKKLVEFEASLPETIPYLIRSYNEAGDVEEKITAILTLAVNGSDEAVGFLVEAMDFFNERKLGGVNPSNAEEQVIRQILYGLGISGNGDLAMPMLSSIEVYDYSNSINRTARAAMENYQ